MPNKILLPFLDTYFNPNKIVEQKKQRKKKRELKQRQKEISKELSNALKAYASAQIKQSEPEHYKRIRLLEVGLKAKEDAHDIHLNALSQANKINGKKILKQARENNFNYTYDADKDIRRFFEYKKRQGKKPDELTAYEYHGDLLTRKIILKDNGRYLTSITIYDKNFFEEMKFSTTKENELHKYTQGKTTVNGPKIFKQYKFNSKTGQIKEYLEGVETNSQGITTAKTIIGYSDSEQCQFALENAVFDESGELTESEPQIDFNVVKDFYVIDVNHSHSF